MTVLRQLAIPIMVRGLPLFVVIFCYPIIGCIQEFAPFVARAHEPPSCSVPFTLASRLPRARVSNFQRYDLLIGLCGPGVVGFPLQNRLMEMESTLWIEEVWIPKLQQEGDASIMEQIAALPGITKGQLDKFNKVQLFLRVIIFVELLNLNGKYIPDIMLIGDWQAGSDWEWMRQLHP